jgi:DNA-binding CsgD family transcriptional regulator
MRGASARHEDPLVRQQVEQLSRSELKVLRYLPTNLSRPEIAAELSVSVNTVSTHIRSIYAKLGATDRSAAGRCARAAAPRSPSQLSGWQQAARPVRRKEPKVTGSRRCGLTCQPAIIVLWTQHPSPT